RAVVQTGLRRVRRSPVLIDDVRARVVRPRGQPGLRGLEAAVERTRLRPVTQEDDWAGKRLPSDAEAVRTLEEVAANRGRRIRACDETAQRTRIIDDVVGHGLTFAVRDVPHVLQELHCAALRLAMGRAVVVPSIDLAALAD